MTEKIITKESEKEKMALQNILEMKRESLNVREQLDGLEEGERITIWDSRKITERLKKYEENGMKKEDLEIVKRDLIFDAIVATKKEFFHNIANFAMFKSWLLTSLDGDIERFENDDEAPRKTAMIFLDIDGLKSVNDNTVGERSGHEAGDEYLKISAKILMEGRTAKWLEEQGLSAIASHRSGDEFMIAVSGDLPLDTESNFVGIDGEEIAGRKIMDYILEKIQEDFNKNEEASKLQNFSDPKQRDTYEEEFKETKVKMPEDLKFKASISGGWASFREAMSSLSASKDVSAIKSYEDALFTILSEMLELSDRKMILNKEDLKEKRRNGTPEEKALEVIYRSGRGGSEKRKIETLKKTVELIKNLEEERMGLENSREELEEGLNNDKEVIDLIKTNFREIRKRIKEINKQISELIEEINL
ncbi:MAG: hypothetical protein ABH881_04480 [bacterium]